VWTDPRPVSAVADLLRADHASPAIVLMYMPRAVSWDALIWTVGLSVWLANRQGWPGTTLATFLSQRPVLGEVVLTLSSLLAGVALSLGAVMFARWFIGLIEPGD
jgi:small-conductance mechanosensitive channel